MLSAAWKWFHLNFMCWPHYRRQYSCYLNLLLLALRTWFIAEHLRSAVDLNGTGASDLNSARAIPTISEGKCENTWEFLGGIQNVINGKWMKFPHLNKLAYLVCFGTTCLDCYAVWPAVSQRLGGVAILTNPFSGSAHLSLQVSTRSWRSKLYSLVFINCCRRPSHLAPQKWFLIGISLISPPSPLTEKKPAHFRSFASFGPLPST